MYSLWKSYALLQHAQQLLFGLVSLGWQQQQQQQMFQPVAALLLSKVSGLTSQQRLCLAPSAAAGHSAANSCVIRRAAPPATVQFFTAHGSDRSGTAAGMASSRKSHHSSSATAAAALTGGPQATRSMAVSFGETPAFRVGSTLLPCACSREHSVDAPVWRRPITAPSTAAVTRAALLLPSVGKRGTSCQQEQQQSGCQLLPCLMRNGKKENRICSSNSGKLSGQSDLQRAEKDSSRLCCRFSVGSGRTPETAAPRASLVQYSLCLEAIPWTFGKNVAVGSISPFGALSSSACSSDSAAASIRKTTETANGAATASAAASGTMCRPLTRVSPAATAGQMRGKTSSFRSAAAGGRREDAADACAPDTGANSPCWQGFTAARMFTQWLRMVFSQNKPLYTSQVERLAADSAAAAGRAPAEETPKTPAATASETAAAPRPAAEAAVVKKGLLKLAEMLPLAGVVLGTDSVATAQKTDDPFQAAGEKTKRTRSLGGDAAHAEKVAAAATRAYFFYLRHPAFLEQKLQRQRSRATGKAPEGAAAVAGGGLQSCRREEISCSGSSTRNTDAGEAKKGLFVCRGVRRSAALPDWMKKTLAWIFWRKEDDTDKDAPRQEENGNSEAAATTRNASEGDGIFAAGDEAKEVYDKGAEEARRQAFRSPAVAATLRFWEETPKFTRFYLSTAFSLSLLSSLYGQSYPRLFSPAALLFDFSAIRQKKQLHRLITSLFFFGPLSLPTFLSLSFVHAYLGGLEQHFQRLEEYSALYSSGSQRASSRRLLSRFPIMSLFAPFSPRHMFSRLLLSSAAAAMTLAALKQIPNEHLLQCISTTLLHVWSRVFPSGEADFYGLFTVSNEYLPFFFLAQNWLFEGRIVAADIYGIGVAALWLLLVQQRLEEYVNQQQRLQSREQQQDQPPT